MYFPSIPLDAWQVQPYLKWKYLETTMGIKHRLMGNNPKGDLERHFFEYHRANPHVYKLFKKFADDVRKAGYKRYSCRTILHRVRWEKDVKTTEADGRTPFKINNNFSPYYARLLMEKNSEFAKFFELRSVIGDKT
jgi:hypothetical protein